MFYATKKCVFFSLQQSMHKEKGFLNQDTHLLVKNNFWPSPEKISGINNFSRLQCPAVVLHDELFYQTFHSFTMQPFITERYTTFFGSSGRYYTAARNSGCITTTSHNIYLISFPVTTK